MLNNIGQMMKQVQKIQEQLARVQEELAQQTVEGMAGGGMVRVVANGKQEILSVSIAPEAMEPESRPMLEDLIAAAVNQALQASRSMMQEEMSKLTGGLRIPGLSL